MRHGWLALAVLLAVCGTAGRTPLLAAQQQGMLVWPEGLPVYDHVVVVIEENKSYDQIVGSADAPYISKLGKEGANLTRFYGEEHHSQGNYFWLLSGSNQRVGFVDKVPGRQFTADNLGAQLVERNLGFKGYAESLPEIGSTDEFGPAGCSPSVNCLYARKHVPWISFLNIPNGTTVATSSNLRFADFPSPDHYSELPAVAIVVPNLQNDMHDGTIAQGDRWLEENIDPYYQWAKAHNSLLIITFDENDDPSNSRGLTNFTTNPIDDLGKSEQNRIPTIFAGAHVSACDFQEGIGVTHVNILRTVESMYGLKKSGAQQPNALAGGISDDKLITDIFDSTPGCPPLAPQN